MYISYRLKSLLIASPCHLMLSHGGGEIGPTGWPALPQRRSTFDDDCPRRTATPSQLIVQCLYAFPSRGPQQSAVRGSVALLVLCEVHNRSISRSRSLLHERYGIDLWRCVGNVRNYTYTITASPIRIHPLQNTPYDIKTGTGTDDSISNWDHIFST